MTCEEFLSTLQHRIDQQESLHDHQGLQQHAAQCDSCRRRWIAWQQIAIVLPAHALQRPLVLSSRWGDRNVTVAAITAMAAVLLAVFLVPQPPEPAIAVVAAVASPQAAERIVLPSHSARVNLAEDTTYLLQTHPAIWLQSVQERDWLDTTMPTVRSLREGVAPLGRSLLRAVTLLTTSEKG